MKFLTKIFFALIAFYLLCWVGMAAYFGFAERHKGLLEENLAGVFGRPVSIESLQTTWVGRSPSMQITGLQVQGDGDGPALAFERASVIVSPVSLFTFWPRFTDFAVEKPILEIATLPDNRIQVAGITLSDRKGPGVNRERLLSWLLNQSSTAWHGGEIRWRKKDGSVQKYSDISFVYDRELQSRIAKLTINAPKGRVTAKFTSEGNLLSSEDWDASVELVSGSDQQMLEPGDLSFRVQDGEGLVRLARLNVERIRDFLALSGLAERTRWILDAELSGLLHDVEFTFSGALTRINDWSIKASATDVDFKSLETLPALNNLNGELRANKDRGSFNFTAVNSTFEWNKFYESPLPIDSAKGFFTWHRDENGALVVEMQQGQLTDPNLNLYDLSAEMVFARGNSRVSSFGDLFTVDSVKDLSYHDGDIVVSGSQRSPQPLNLKADAKFDVSDMSALHRYLPKVDKLKAFRGWVRKAYKQGQLENGRARYQGALTPKAIENGDAELEILADFKNVTVDYAPNNDWPPAENSDGSTVLKNDFLTVTPTKLELNGDEVTDGYLTIERIFYRDIVLKLRGKTSTSLSKGMAFVFQGPLIKPENRPQVLPVQPTGGQVDIDVSLALPLAKGGKVSVTGTSTVRNGDVILPEGVPLTDINSVIEFTEDTIKAENITATFLGGKTSASLHTVTPAQPPVMQLKGQGEMVMSELTPWMGEHLLTWFEGKANWEGSLDIDGENLVVNSRSALVGVEITAPKPLAKSAESPSLFTLSMDLGGKRSDGQTPASSLAVTLENLLRADFSEDLAIESPSLFDKALIQVGTVEQPVSLPEGVNFDIEYAQLDLDELIESVIDLAVFEPLNPTENTDFLDALRSVQISTPNAISMYRPFGQFEAVARSKDGWGWSGTLTGDNIEGSLSMLPREDVGRYNFDLAKLIINPLGDVDVPVTPIDPSLMPADYPAFDMKIKRFRMDGRELGALSLSGRPTEESWKLEQFSMNHNGISTTAAGQWANSESSSSITAFDFSTSIEEAENVLTDMDFDGYIKKGRGAFGGTVSWPGAPHEFDYSRLNGNFDLFLKDGELVQVEPGGGKLLGLLNFNAIARRLIFDFRDVFASGLQFDRMRYRGLITNGEAILQDAFILTPAVFVRMEGKLDLDKELIDMDVHISPELGGNLTLLSALANPTAGAVVFITSQLFKDDMRRASFKSYQAKGTWEDFEMVEIDSEGIPIESQANKPSSAPAEPITESPKS